MARAGLGRNTCRSYQPASGAASSCPLCLPGFSSPPASKTKPFSKWSTDIWSACEPVGLRKSQEIPPVREDFLSLRDDCRFLYHDNLLLYTVHLSLTIDEYHELLEPQGGGGEGGGSCTRYQTLVHASRSHFRCISGFLQIKGMPRTCTQYLIFPHASHSQSRSFSVFSRNAKDMHFVRHWSMHSTIISVVFILNFSGIERTWSLKALSSHQEP